MVFSLSNGSFTIGISGTNVNFKLKVPFTDTSLDVGFGMGIGGIREIQGGYTTTNADGIALPIILPLIRLAFK